MALTQKRKKLQISVCGINTGNIHEILLFCFLSLLFFPLKKGKEKKKSLFAYCHDKPQSYIEKEPTLVVLLKDSMDVFRLPLNAMKKPIGTYSLQSRLDQVQVFENFKLFCCVLGRS